MSWIRLPGAASDDPVLSQAEDRLENFYGFLCLRAKDPVRNKLWNQRIIVGNPVQLLLNFHNITAGRTEEEAEDRDSRRPLHRRLPPRN